MSDRPSPRELWEEAGGGTPRFSRERYRELMIEHGHLVPLPPGKKAEPLPCGWPHNRAGNVRAVPLVGPPHDYVSTACQHAAWTDDPAEAARLHGYCSSMVGHQGIKRPAQCKWCDAVCRCGCHVEAAAGGR